MHTQTTKLVSTQSQVKWSGITRALGVLVYMFVSVYAFGKYYTMINRWHGDTEGKDVMVS